MTVAASYSILSSPTETLTKTFDVDADGEIIRGDGGHISRGNIKRVDRTADDVPAWMRAFAPDIEMLTHNQALMPGIAINGIAFQNLTTKLHPQTDAVTRTQNNFGFTSPALACLDGDRPGSTDLYADALVIEPSLADVCVTRRLSVSGSVIKPDGTPLSENEHLFMMVSQPERMREYADLMVEMSFLRGKGWFKISDRGGKLIRGVFDQYVFTTEHVLYEGDGVIKGKLGRRPRPLTFANTGTKVFDVNAAIVRAKTLLSDPDNALIVAKAKAAALSALAIEIATKRQAWFERNKARLLARGISKKRIENEFRIKRAVFRDERTDEHDGEKYPRLLLTSLDDLQMDDGSTLSVGDFLALPPVEQRKFEYRHCADPYEPDYNGSRSTATFLWSEHKNRMMIFSHAHGGAIYWMQQTEHFDGDESFNPDLPWEYFDYVSLLTDSVFIHVPTKRRHMVAKKLDNHLPRTPGLTPAGRPTMVGATTIIDGHYFVHALTWFPGHPTFMVDWAVSSGIVKSHPGSILFNSFDPPPAFPGGDASLAVDYVQLIYDLFGVAEGNMLLDWLAWVVQNVGKKIGHMLVLGGNEGIGKSTILQPLMFFLGEWNVKTVSIEEEIAKEWTDWRRNLFIVVNEVHDTGDEKPWKMEDKLKQIGARPPDWLSVNEKYGLKYTVPNVINVAMTTNHSLSAVHLSSEEARRYLMLGSKVTREELGEARLIKLATWLNDRGGWIHCVQFLLDRDVSKFNPNAAPPKTWMFEAAVESSKSAVEVEIEDALDDWVATRKSEYVLFTLDDLTVDSGASSYIRNPKYRSVVSNALFKLGWITVRNPDDKRGKWLVPAGLNSATFRRRMLYGPAGMASKDLIQAAKDQLALMKAKK